MRASAPSTGPLFLRHSESESPAIVVLVNSRLAANAGDNAGNAMDSLY